MVDISWVQLSGGGGWWDGFRYILACGGGYILAGGEYTLVSVRSWWVVVGRGGRRWVVA